ncbi:MAG TPA: MFS transporter [Thermoanaerobaculia bacterium]|nr:MFS transporter [Thermoanaerobaculia bacterium]
MPPTEAESSPPSGWLAKRFPPGLRTKLSWISLLYLAEGFPFGIVYKVWPVYFRVHGLDLGSIGLLALLRLPYTLKPAWAPFVDRFGSRQGWILGCELGLAAVTLLIPLFNPVGPTELLGLTLPLAALWVLLGCFTLFSATQDVAIDAYAVDVATPRDSGHINGIRVAAYRAAMQVSGGVLLMLATGPSADLLQRYPAFRFWPKISWEAMWVTAGVICLVLGLLAFKSPRVPRPKSLARPDLPAGQLLWVRAGLGALVLAFVALGFWAGWPTRFKVLAALSVVLFVVSFLNPAMLRWAFTWQMLPVVLFGLLYKVGDNALGQMVEPFWVDRGFASEIGPVSNIGGLWLTIVGALLGGVFIARFGIFRALLWLGLAQLLSNFGYVAVAALDAGRPGLYAASFVESLTQGLGTAAFLSFLMNLCDKDMAATQFAFLSALFSLTRDLAGALSGFGVEAWGYTGYFFLTSLLALPGLLLLPLVKNRIREAANGPAD